MTTLSAAERPTVTMDGTNIATGSEGAGRAWWSNGARRSARGTAADIRDRGVGRSRARRRRRGRQGREGGVCWVRRVTTSNASTRVRKKRAGRRLRAATRRVSCRAGQIRTCEGARKTLARTLLSADAAGRPRTDEAEINHLGKSEHGKRSARRAERRTSWRRGGEAPRGARIATADEKRGQTSPRVSSCELQSCAQREHVVDLKSPTRALSRSRKTAPNDSAPASAIAADILSHTGTGNTTRRSLKITRCD